MPIEELAESLTPTQTFIMVGDTGSGMPGQQQVADAIERFCQERQTCQSVFILGDVIYEKGVKTIDDHFSSHASKCHTKISTYRSTLG